VNGLSTTRASQVSSATDLKAGGAGGGVQSVQTCAPPVSSVEDNGCENPPRVFGTHLLGKALSAWQASAEIRLFSSELPCCRLVASPACAASHDVISACSKAHRLSNSSVLVLC
jgi:hypothetical protein